MSDTAMTMDQIRAAGLDALARELGAVGMVRFLQQFETGRGDYSADRHDLLGEGDLASLVAAIRRRRRRK